LLAKFNHAQLYFNPIIPNEGNRTLYKKQSQLCNDNLELKKKRPFLGRGYIPRSKQYIDEYPIEYSKNAWNTGPLWIMPF